MKDQYLIPAGYDAHVHLRDGDVAKVVTPTIRSGGCDSVMCMPNLVPPITTVDAALGYRERLQAIDPSIEYLVTLFLDESITPDVIRAAKKAGVTGVKSYPKGTTTNSAGGVISYDPFFPTFAAMEEVDMVLNIHGEVPSDPSKDVSVLNAESKFLPTLLDIHRRFPKLRIVLEHCTTADAVKAVRACGPTVAGTITAHHLSLVIDHAVSDVFCFCKPVAKSPEDRRALLQAVVSSEGKFFLGTDSAPHDISAKKGKGATAAGVFTQPFACQYILTALEEGIERGDIKDEEVTEDLLRGFLSEWGRNFYKIEQSKAKILLKRSEQVIPESTKGLGVEIVNYRAGRQTWSLEWQS
ncbi:dihydroorotase [Plectosphaerella plurivora]|uniref:dihydroorotase n=1 Tax=Plectosphaerella plurivora TaxID=936078 RepID=A0A9P9AAF5_9PEZI|nr:dihydroorotase [Plectosphaerella plurivora]